MRPISENDIEASSLTATVGPGLTFAEVEAARRRGEGNAAGAGSSRTYAQILRASVFTLFNNLLFGIGVALLVLGRVNDAVVSVGLGLVNSVIGAAQEIRAKRKLDALKLLHRSRSRVIREGADHAVAPGELVRGDLVRVGAGDQIVVDGPLVRADRLEVDESLLTGESRPIVKREGDTLLSGSICLSGEGVQRAEAVGAASHAAMVTAVARQWTDQRTPLQRIIDMLVRLLMVVVALLSITILGQAALRDLPLLRVVQTAAVLSGLIPYGLFFLVTVSYAAGAARISRRGALIQQINAVESLSNVDVLCTDKTGTLTSGLLRLEEVRCVEGADPRQVRDLLGAVAHSVSAPNLTTAALRADLPGEARPVRAEIPFSSHRRYSAVEFDPNGLYVLGAVDALGPVLVPGTAALNAEVMELATRGLRVLLFAVAADSAATFSGDVDELRLPALRPLALLVLSDELRPHVEDTVAELHAQGVQVKVLSGDDPRTVAVVARRIGIEDPEPVSGADLAALDPAAFDAAVARHRVFGRVSPPQKERIIDALVRQGSYTAMIGDGVNDVPSLKRAQVGIAMQSGSSVARDIASLVLLGDSFAALVPAQQEGRRIITGIWMSLYLYLTRVVTAILIILVVAVLGLGFPYEPAQVAIVLITVGLPTLVLTAWARPDPPQLRLSSIARFVVPAALATAVFATGLYVGVYELVQRSLIEGRIPGRVIDRFELFTGVPKTQAEFIDRTATILAQTSLTIFTASTAFLLVLFLAPPARFFTGWATVSADKRPAYLVAALFALLGLILSVPPLTHYFSLLPEARLAGFGLCALVLWFFALRAVWRRRILDRVLGLRDEM